MSKHNRSNKIRSLGESISKYIKAGDTFGVPVNLTYKSEPKIKSVLGGFITLIIRLCIFAYLVY